MTRFNRSLRKWTVLFVMALFYLTQSANALVIGIDFGVDSFKIVMVKPGGIDIVLNEASGRKTPTAIGYSAHGRVFGDQATQLYTKNPAKVFNSINEILGRRASSLDEPWIQDHIHGHHHLYWLKNATLAEEPSETLEGEDHSRRVLVRVGDQIVYTEEVLAQILAKAREYSTSEAGATVKDCTISVPFYWSHAQRQALLDAANLAGLNVLSLINQNMAIAIKFLTDRDFDQGPKNVVFYDMGTSDLQVSVYRFDAVKGKGKAKWINNATLLATASDQSLGGSAFDNVIVDMCVKKVKAKFGEDFELPPQAITKLQKQAKKTKEILSANRETSLSIESLLPDYDFKTIITRDEFEKQSEKLFARALDTLKQALDTAGISPKDIAFFELFGGGPRIPKIQEVLKSYLDPLPLSRHLNSDEAAAFGAAIFAASKSSQHRVKEFNIKDGSNAYHLIVVRATDASGNSLVESADAADTNQDIDKILYKENSRLGSRRTLKISTDQDVFVDLKYPSSVQLAEGVSHLIGKYQISFPADLKTRYNVTGTPQVNIKFELTSSGTVVLTSADAQVPIVSQKTVKVKVDKPAQESTTESNQDSDSQESSESSSEDKPENDQTSTEQASESTTDSKSQEEETEKKVEEVTEVRSVHSKVTVKLSIKKLAHVGLTPAQLEEARLRLKILDSEEKLRLETERARSDLEALIYTIYDKLEDPSTVKFSTEAERTILSESCAKDSNWLEEEGSEALKAAYIERKSELAQKWNKITFRIAEHTAFPKTVETCTQLIELSRETLAKIEETRNVTKEEIDQVLDMIKDVEDYVTKSAASESAKLAHEDPKVTSANIQDRCREFGWRIDMLTKRPRKAKPVEQQEQKPIEPVETTEGAPEDLEKQTENQSNPPPEKKDEL